MGAAKEVTIEKVRRNKDRNSGGDSTVIDVGRSRSLSDSTDQMGGWSTGK